MKHKRNFTLFLVFFLVCGFCNSICSAQDRVYDVNIVDWDARGTTHWVVTDIIELSVTSTSGSLFVCGNPETIVQGSNQAEIFPWGGAGTALIIWEAGFEGCDDIREGVTISATIEQFPDWFDIWSPFRIWWDDDDYIDVEAGTPPQTTSSTTTTVLSTTSSVSDGICMSEVIYGEDSKETEVLRFVRDNVLSKTSEGRALIRQYYLWSPVIVGIMEEDESFKEDLRNMIDEVLSTVEDIE